MVFTIGHSNRALDELVLLLLQLSETSAEIATPTSFAVVQRGRVHYPPP